MDLKKEHGKEVTIDTLCAQNTELHNENEHIKSKLSKIEHDYANLTTEMETVRRALSEERQKNEALEKKTADLRSMLVPPPEVKLSDMEMVQRFTSLRTLIHKLVKSTWDHKWLPTPIAVGSELTIILQPFYKGAVHARYMDNCLCGYIFSVLNQKIFGVRNFGLPPNLGKINTFLGDTEVYVGGHQELGKKLL